MADRSRIEGEGQRHLIQHQYQQEEMNLKLQLATNPRAGPVTVVIAAHADRKKEILT